MLLCSVSHNYRRDLIDGDRLCERFAFLIHRQVEEHLIEAVMPRSQGPGR